eukprot:TRINITY_DN27375_c0_g1_i1.p1 TRINITY_DN27375_c0_g1~~TRINITY_DN27375_c0_g1_i1.p1  ORF type:complete len:277 (+),score=68.53 TRINITY_DN27375_c0_g1_i1:78-908(+)
MFFPFFFFFFFQAEDGIRDAQESRGLGDVYKRQFSMCMLAVAPGPDFRRTRRKAVCVTNQQELEFLMDLAAQVAEHREKMGRIRRIRRKAICVTDVRELEAVRALAKEQADALVASRSTYRRIRRKAVCVTNQEKLAEIQGLAARSREQGGEGPLAADRETPGDASVKHARLDVQANHGLGGELALVKMGMVDEIMPWTLSPAMLEVMEACQSPKHTERSNKGDADLEEVEILTPSSTRQHRLRSRNHRRKASLDSLYSDLSVDKPTETEVMPTSV